MLASKCTQRRNVRNSDKRPGTIGEHRHLLPQGHSRWEYKDMAEDIRISVDTSHLRDPNTDPRANRFTVLKDAALPIAILGFALLVFVAL